MYVHTYICMYIHTYVCTYIRTYVLIYVCTFVNTKASQSYKREDFYKGDASKGGPTVPTIHISK